MTTQDENRVVDVDFDHTDVAYLNAPRRTFKELQTRCPVAHSSEFSGFWILSRYDDIVQATRSTEVFSSGQGVTIPFIGSPIPLLPIEADPPRHSAFRKALQREFSRSRMKEIEVRIRQLVNELIDGFVNVGRADLVAELAAPVPAIVIAQLMGFPPADWAPFRTFAERLVATSKGGDPQENQRAAMAFVEYLNSALEERRSTPRDDMLTRILHAEIDGRSLNPDEALGMTWLTLIAGHETTVGGIGSLLMHVGADSALRSTLVEDPSLIPRAVEEAIRMEAPIQGMGRTLTCDVSMHGQTMRKGDKVWLLFAAGNHDEVHFTNPGEFDVNRTSNRHLGFGDGIHRCVGAPLAQLELRIVLEELLRRIPDFRIEDAESVVFDGAQSRAPVHLWANW